MKLINFKVMYALHFQFLFLQNSFHKALSLMAKLIENATISMRLFKLENNDSVKRLLISLRESRIYTVVVMVQAAVMGKMLGAARKLFLLSNDHIWLNVDLVSGGGGS